MSTSNSSGSGICTILLVVFIVLKLVGVISWGWAWVLSPFWIPLAIALFFAGVRGCGWSVGAMTELLTWIGQHPILTVFILWALVPFGCRCKS